ncbi:MAG: WG repeat-containing protein [Microscillaceae bacterium]|nr:WG repeat-containing protein [Microscillaceae bacterium]
MQLFNSHQEEIFIHEIPLGQGGQGNVYQILQPDHLRYHVVKIYHPRERSKKRKFKINYMIQNVPYLEDDLALIWPEDLIYDDQEFVGFLMPKAPGEIDLTSLCVLKESNKLDECWKIYYARESKQGIYQRAKVCLNIASAIHTLHKTGQYVLVDIKPENIKISLKGQISLIDLDSIEIFQEDKLLFAADKLSTEYSPAEIQNLDLHKDVIPVYWDSFSMAVVFYKVLFGLHPFTGTPKKPYETCVTQEQKIKAGLLPVGKNARNFQIIPKPHQNFKSLSPSLQNLFLRALDKKSIQHPEDRPSAEEWVRALGNFQLDDKKYQNPVRISSPQTQTVKKNKFNSPIEFLMSRKDRGHGIISLVSLFVMGVTIWCCIYFGQAFAPHKRHSNTDFFTPPDYHLLVEGPFLASKNDKYGYVNENQDLVINYQYDDAGHFIKGLAKVELDGRQGFINPKGIEIVPLIYDEVYEFEEGLARVRLNKKEGFVNRQGQIQIPLLYERVEDFAKGRAAVVLHHKIGLIDKQGKIIIPTLYNIIQEQQYGIYKVTKGNVIGFLDNQGNPITPMIYHYALDFSEGLAAVAIAGQGWGYINTKGQIVISLGYSSAFSFHEGLARVETPLEGLGFIDTQGQRVIPFQYEMAEDFMEGLAAVKTGGKWGFINRSGHTVIPAIYDKVFDEGFIDGKAKVVLGTNLFFIDYQGNCVKNCPTDKNH